MWYFSWILGLGLACTVSILNAMWFELLEDQHEAETRSPTDEGNDGNGQ